MDKTMLRHTALQIANSRVPGGLPVEDMLAEADKIEAWLSDGVMPTSQPATSTTQESQAAVEGQEPKGE